MARDIEIIFDDILDMILILETSLAGKSATDLDGDIILKFAVQRAIEIISEASKHIPAEITATAPDIPWKSIRGMGNILRHEYHRIADEVIWDVIRHDLPPLKVAILAFKDRHLGTGGI
jgi:uncharacterized protein with HEPN domain